MNMTRTDGQNFRRMTVGGIAAAAWRAVDGAGGERETLRLVQELTEGALSCNRWHGSLASVSCGAVW